MAEKTVQIRLPITLVEKVKIMYIKVHEKIPTNIELGVMALNTLEKSLEVKGNK